MVLDNVNIHTPSVLYGAFPPAEARRIAAKLEFHLKPKHGSWLNMAEAEIAVLSRRCLARRTPDVDARIAAWEQRRNRHRVSVDWRFTTADARVKLERLYPA